MSLREAAWAVARTALPAPPARERLLAVERVAAALENRRLPAPTAAPAALLRRRLWRGQASVAAVDAALALRMRSLDRAVIAAFLLGWPAGAALAPAARTAAGRHDWPWRTRGECWRLWDGPEALGAALREAGDTATLLRAAGLHGPLSRSGFAMAALAVAGRR